MQQWNHKGKKRRTTIFLVTVLLSMYVICPAAYAADTWSSIHTSYYEDSDISLTIEGDKMLVGVPQTEEYSYIVVYFMDSDGESPKNLQAVETVDGKVEYTLKERDDGVYYVQLYKKSEDPNYYTSVLEGKHSVAVRFRNNEASIEPSTVYNEQKALFEARDESTAALYYYLQPSADIQSDDEEIISLAREITSETDGAYSTAKAIHDWVAGHIYYDYDAVENLSSSPGTTWPVDARGTYEKERTVCEGYANLVSALMRASGIPAKTVFGFALTDASMEWDSKNTHGHVANHAWNEVYVNGRWVIMDTTWDSKNIYYEGEYTTTDSISVYYDNTEEFFSYTHRQSVADTYDSGYIKTVFSDVNSHWSYENIKFVVNNDMMNGVGDGMFAPNSETTQAMFVTILGRLSGDSIRDAGAGEKWYVPYREWAESNAITKGIPSFSPENIISREMMAVILMNYAQHKGLDTGGNADTEFTDSALISDWAKADAAGLAAWGVVTGRDDGTFDPEASFTRAEMAVIINRIAEKQLLEYVG